MGPFTISGKEGGRGDMMTMMGSLVYTRAGYLYVDVSGYLEGFLFLSAGFFSPCVCCDRSHSERWMSP